MASRMKPKTPSRAPPPEEKIPALLKAAKARAKRVYQVRKISKNSDYDYLLEWNFPMFMRFTYDPRTQEGAVIYDNHVHQGQQKRQVPQWARQSPKAFLLWVLQGLEVECERLEPKW